MYNDYYLEQINGKLNNTNNNLNTIIQNQEIIKLQNQTLISGDIQIQNNQAQINQSITLTTIVITTILILIFLIRGLK